MNGQDSIHIAATLGEQEAIKTVIIIDDVFDPPERATFLETDIRDFYTHLENNEKALQELAQIGLVISTSDDINDQVIQALWACQEQASTLWDVCKVLFTRIIENLSQVTRFSDYLKNELGYEVITLGRNHNDLDKYLIEKSIDLIFIDYYLGPVQEQEFSTQKAIEIAGKIRSRVESSPLVILMSSHKVPSDAIAKFRDRSKLLQGMFHFISKNDFHQKDKLSLLLGAFSRTLPTRHKIQQFVDALQASIPSVSDKFLADIRALGLNDYAYIQKLSLQTDGHPLGDYMLWLYSSYFGHLLFENEEVVRAQKDQIDSLKFDEFPPIHVSPSLQLAEIYKSALFDMSVGDVSEYSEKTNSQTNSSTDNLPEKVLNQQALHLGDLFIKDSLSDVLMVINPECDLAFTPGDNARRFHSDRSIMLIPGGLQPLNEGLGKSDKVRIELFKYQEQAYRILWDVKRVIFHPYETVVAWLKERGYQRSARLRLPFALEVQQAFAANLTRIGMPVAPPIYQPVKVQLLCEAQGGGYEVLDNLPDELASLVLMKENGKYILKCLVTVDFGGRLKQAIDKCLELLEQYQNALDNQDKKVRVLAGKRQQLQTFKAKFDDWFFAFYPFPLPQADKEKKIAGVPISILRNQGIEGQYSFDNPLLLNIIDAINYEDGVKSDQTNTPHPEPVGGEG